MKFIKMVGLVLAFSGMALTAYGQSIVVTCPAGGERWALGTSATITWTATGVSGDVRIILVDSSGAVAGQISSAVAAARGSHSWNVGELTSGTAAVGENYRIRIRAIGSTASDTSRRFAITGPAAAPESELTLTAPNGGQVWNLGEMQNITWRSRNLEGVEWIKLELYKDGRDAAHRLGIISASVALGRDGVGSLAWSPGIYVGGTAPVGNNCYYVRVSTLDNALSDFSDAPFSINQPFQLIEPVQAAPFTQPAPGGPSIEVPTPLAPLTLTRNFTINWRAEGVTGELVINLLRESGGTYTLATSVSPGLATGHFTWTVGLLANPTSPFPNVTGQRFRFQVAGRGASGVSRWFEIVRPELNVTEPHANERLRRGDRKTIRWSGSQVQGKVHIDAYYSRLPGATLVKYQRLFSDVSNLGWQDWTVWPRPRPGTADLEPPPTGDDVRWHIRVISARVPTVFANSGEFIIE